VRHGAIDAQQRQRTHTQVAGGAVLNDPRFGTRWVDERAGVPAQLLDDHEEVTKHPLPQALQHAAHLRHGDADGRHESGLLRAPAWPLGRDVPPGTYAKWVDVEHNDREMERL